MASNSNRTTPYKQQIHKKSISDQAIILDDVIKNVNVRRVWYNKAQLDILKQQSTTVYNDDYIYTCYRVLSIKNEYINSELQIYDSIKSWMINHNIVYTGQDVIHLKPKSVDLTHQLLGYHTTLQAASEFYNDVVAYGNLSIFQYFLIETKLLGSQIIYIDKNLCIIRKDSLKTPSLILSKNQKFTIPPPSLPSSTNTASTDSIIKKRKKPSSIDEETTPSSSQPSHKKITHQTPSVVIPSVTLNVQPPPCREIVIASILLQHIGWVALSNSSNPIYNYYINYTLRLDKNDNLLPDTKQPNKDILWFQRRLPHSSYSLNHYKLRNYYDFATHGFSINHLPIQLFPLLSNVHQICDYKHQSYPILNKHIPIRYYQKDTINICNTNRPENNFNILFFYDDIPDEWRGNVNKQTTTVVYNTLYHQSCITPECLKCIQCAEYKHAIREITYYMQHHSIKLDELIISIYFEPLVVNQVIRLMLDINTYIIQHKTKNQAELQVSITNDIKDCSYLYTSLLYTEIGSSEHEVLCLANQNQLCTCSNMNHKILESYDENIRQISSDDIQNMNVTTNVYEPYKYTNPPTQFYFNSEYFNYNINKYLTTVDLKKSKLVCEINPKYVDKEESKQPTSFEFGIQCYRSLIQSNPNHLGLYLLSKLLKRQYPDYLFEFNDYNQTPIPIVYKPPSQQLLLPPPSSQSLQIPLSLPSTPLHPPIRNIFDSHLTNTSTTTINTNTNANHELFLDDLLWNNNSINNNPISHTLPTISSYITIDGRCEYKRINKTEQRPNSGDDQFAQDLISILINQQDYYNLYAFLTKPASVDDNSIIYTIPLEYMQQHHSAFITLIQTRNTNNIELLRILVDLHSLLYLNIRR